MCIFRSENPARPIGERAKETENEKITSRTDFFGQTIHYDEHGRKIGSTRPDPLGGQVLYDANGKQVCRSRENFSAARSTMTTAAGR